MDSSAARKSLLGTVLVAAFVALPPTVLAIATLVSSSKHTDQGDKLIEKTEQVHVLVNSRMSQVKLDLLKANERIATSDERIAKLQLLVEKLLQERAAATQPPTPK